jgi:hypothetical protein
MGEPENLMTAFVLPNGVRHVTMSLRLPLQVGDTLSDSETITIFDHGQSISRVRDVVVATARDTLIIVPAGRFRCFELTKVRIPQLEYDRWPTISLYGKAEIQGRAWVTPGIGIIKIVGAFGLWLPVGQGMLWELVAARIGMVPPEDHSPYSSKPIILPPPP